MSRPSFADAAIAASNTKSAMIRLAGTVPNGFYTPAALDGTAITFEAAEKEDGVFKPVKSSGGSALTFTVTTNSYYGFTKDQSDHFRGAEFIKLVSGSSESAARLLKVALRDPN